MTTVFPMSVRRIFIAAAAAALLAGAPSGAYSAEKVNVGVFPVSSSLPYFIALDLGYFKELDLEPQPSR
jgi:NitT/TauT family transport system substrate-binding protein